MNNQEKRLFKQLCSFQTGKVTEDALTAATPSVLGQIFYNRMQGVAYGVLMQNELLGQTNREFRNSLKAAYEVNLEKNDSFFKCVDMVSDLLSNSHSPYALLKGAALCRLYPAGYRTSNDIDLLTLPEMVSEIGDHLEQAGFRQGNIRNDVFTPATRQEIIASKMLRGETVPYIKEINLPGMKYLELDINFSLDYKNGDTETLRNLLCSAAEKDFKGLRVRTLSEEDFFIHLCCHLYKEATTFPWVKMHRDMTLYKYADIYLLLSIMDDVLLGTVFERAKQMALEKECAFAVLQTAALFDVNNRNAIKTAETILQKDPLFLHRVFAPQEKKTFLYDDINIENRFYMERREDHLKEEKNNESIEYA